MRSFHREQKCCDASQSFLKRSNAPGNLQDITQLHKTRTPLPRVYAHMPCQHGVADGSYKSWQHQQTVLSQVRTFKRGRCRSMLGRESSLQQGRQQTSQL